MAKKAVKQVEKVTREAVRGAYQIRSGHEIPPMVKESVYPWGMLLEGEPGTLSFFVPCDSQEDAESRRSPIQSSGNNYYSKRRIPRRAVSRIVSEGEVIGVESWSVVSAE
jgi:hypothetical protein